MRSSGIYELSTRMGSLGSWVRMWQVCLGYKSPSVAICENVDSEDKTTFVISESGSKYKSKTTFINESGLYSLILSSKLPQAKEFKRWVTNEVLPQIRKTGGYIPLNDCEDGADIMARALMIAHRTIEQKDALLEMQKPKVRFAEAVTGSDGSILIGELAKLITQNGYEIGRTRLFDWLRRNGYLFKNSTEPIQKWVEKGLFETKVSGLQPSQVKKIRTQRREDAEIF